ncbi:MAG: porin family protein, partial [bacterium]|nr:porin family protein [bacterium]
MKLLKHKKFPRPVLKKLGFETEDMIKNSVLGEALDVYITSPDALAVFEPDSDPQDVLLDVNEISYPVYVRGAPVSSITLVQRNGDWELGIIGDRGVLFADSARKIHAASNPDTIHTYFIVRVQPLYLTFLAYYEGNGLHLILTHEDDDLELAPHESAPAAEVFMELKRILTMREPGRGGRFGFGFNSGWSAWKLDDFAVSQKSFQAEADMTNFDVISNGLNGSFFGGIDFSLEFNLANSHKLGVSAGFQYLPGGTFETGLVGNFATYNTKHVKLGLSGFKIPLELYYKLLVSGDFFLRFAAGTDYYNATVDYDFTLTVSDKPYLVRGKLKDWGFGGHVSMGAEYSLNQNFALTLTAGYSFAKPDNFTGMLTDSNGIADKSLLTMGEGEFGEILGHYPVSLPLTATHRPAEIDISGFGLSV